MPREHPSHRLELDVTAGREPDTARPEPDTPLCIALLGDFSGRGASGIVGTSSPLVHRRPIPVDRDRVDEALARMAPVARVPLDASGEVVAIHFAELDDFHPDRLIERLPLLRDVWNARRHAAS